MPLKLGPCGCATNPEGGAVLLECVLIAGAARTRDEEREANARAEEKARRIFGLN